MFGTIAVDGSVQLSADAIGGDATVGFGGNGGNALGGTAYVQADGSEEEGASLTIAGDATMLASGRGGVGGAGDGAAIAAGSGGSGTGGTYQGTPGSGGAFAIAGRDTGELSIGGETILVANGFGGAGGTGGTGQAGGTGGAGTGGTAQAGTFAGQGSGALGEGQAIYDALILEANGTGGAGGAGASGLGLGGAGTGGLAAVFANGSLVSAGDITTLADGLGGNGSTGGNGTGGASGFGVVGGTLIADTLASSAHGDGGTGSTGNGGDGTGGEASLNVDGSATVAAVNFASQGRGGGSARATAVSDAAVWQRSGLSRVRSSTPRAMSISPLMPMAERVKSAAMPLPVRQASKLAKKRRRAWPRSSSLRRPKAAMAISWAAKRWAAARK